MVKVKAQFKRRSTANNVEIYVPVPDDADTPKFRVSCEKYSYTSSFQLLMHTPRRPQALYNMHQTNPRSSGRSSSSAVRVSSLCERTLVFPAFGEVRTFKARSSNLAWLTSSL